MSSRAPARAKWIPLGARGLLAMLAIVVLGILPGAGYLSWRAPQVRAEIDGRLAGISDDPAERLDHWMRFGEPQIHTRLGHLRFSARYPFLITHTVKVPGGDPEIWGLDLTSASSVRFAREGLRVELRLPAPRLLGHGLLRGDNAHRVPSFPSRAHAGDASARARELVVWFLGGMIAALPQDIPGAELAVHVEAVEPVEEILGPRGEG